MAAPVAPAERSGPSLASLPDSALVVIFNKCSMSERLQRLSLVCKEWRDLCATPSLISTAAVGEASGVDALQQMRSLQLWLPRQRGPEQVPNAATVEELALMLRYPSEDAEEVQQLIAAAAASCSQRLQRLEIRMGAPPPPQQPRLIVSSWVCGVKKLTQLAVGAQRVHVPVSLASLTALDRLELMALSLEIPAGSWLPPNLTSLVCAHVRMPEQATSLQRLQHVHLRNPTAAALTGSLGVMTRLAPSVTSLLLEGNLAAIPPELAALSGQLQKLVFKSTHPAVVDIGSVSALTGLTRLTLQAPVLGPAPGLQQLSQLDTLGICNDSNVVPAINGLPVLRSLPPGGWLRVLGTLVLSYDVLFGSLDVLPAAPRLESVDIVYLQRMPAVPPPGEPQPRWDALRVWLCTHPALRWLSLRHCDVVLGELLHLVLALAQRRPSLAVECHRT